IPELVLVVIMPGLVRGADRQVVAVGPDEAPTVGLVAVVVADVIPQIEPLDVGAAEAAIADIRSVPELVVRQRPEAAVGENTDVRVAGRHDWAGSALERELLLLMAQIH